MMLRPDRFLLFVERLAAAPPAATHDEAFDTLGEILDVVEDELSGVVKDPEKYLDDGRLYPPQRDSRRKVAGRSDVVRYRSKRHNTWIGANGAIRIEQIERGACCLDKPGKDGRKVQL